MPARSRAERPSSVSPHSHKSTRLPRTMDYKILPKHLENVVLPRSQSLKRLICRRTPCAVLPLCTLRHPKRAGLLWAFDPVFTDQARLFLAHYGPCDQMATTKPRSRLHQAQRLRSTGRVIRTSCHRAQSLSSTTARSRRAVACFGRRESTSYSRIHI